MVVSPPAPLEFGGYQRGTRLNYVVALRSHLSYLGNVHYMQGRDFWGQLKKHWSTEKKKVLISQFEKKEIERILGL